MQKPVAARWMPSLGQTRGVARPTGCGRAHAGVGWQRSIAWSRSLRAGGGAAARRRGGAAARRLKAGRDGGCHRIAQGRRTPLPPCLVSGAVHASGAMPPCQPARAIPRAFSVSSTAKRTKSTRPHAPKVCLSSASSASKGRLPTKTRHELHACVAGGAGLQWHPHAHGLWLRSSSGLGLGAGDRAPGRARLELGPGLGFGPRC